MREWVLSDHASQRITDKKRITDTHQPAENGRRRIIAVVGADGCGAGWFAVRLEGNGQWQTRVFESIGLLWAAWHDASLVLVDIPIGLPIGEDKRRCDVEARQILGRPRGSSVFPPPCRVAPTPATYEQASQANWEVTGRLLSQQTWGILPRIREVDRLVRNNDEARSMIREVHPEMCFCAFNCALPMSFRKTTPEGYEERTNVLLKFDPRTDDNMQAALAQFPRGLVARHDIVDALVASFTAKSAADMLLSIPAEPEWDGALRIVLDVLILHPFAPFPLPKNGGCRGGQEGAWFWVDSIHNG